MTPALATHADQARHYAAVRARLWPTVRRQPIAPPKPDWIAPKITPVYRDDDDRIAAILIECGYCGQLTAGAVIDITAEVFGIPAADIIGKSRHDEHAHPRLIAMAVARLLLAESPVGAFSVLGKVFERDRSSVVHACGRHAGVVSRVREKIAAAR